MRRFIDWLLGKPLPDTRERILSALSEMGGHAFTYDLWRKLDERIALPVILGALYVELERMEEDGLLRSSMAPGGPERGYRQKRSYGLTDKGRLEADRLAGRPVK